MATNTQKKIRNKIIYQIFTRNYKDGTFKAVDFFEKIFAFEGEPVILIL